jgi:hypothetical protein
MYFVMPATGCNQVASPSYATGDSGTWVVGRYASAAGNDPGVALLVSATGSELIYFAIAVAGSRRWASSEV